METQVHGWTLGEIAEMVGGDLSGPRDLVVRRPVPAGSDDPEGITFAESDRYLQSVLSSNVGAVIVKRGMSVGEKPSVAVDSPRAAFGLVLARSVRPLSAKMGIHATAIVSPNAKVHERACIGAYVVVEDDAEIGDTCVLYPFSYVGPGCKLGEMCVLYPHAVLYQDVTLGARCHVHSGAVIGADGFGYAWTGKYQSKVPQVGGVVIGDDVEIGANTCIDRATCGETTIGDGTKLDNLVQVGHNSSVGEHSLFAAQSGLSGSVKIGDRVTLAGQSAVSDHVEVTNDVVLGGRSGVFKDIEDPGQYQGFPPLPLASAMRVMALQVRLPELFRRLKQLEDEVAGLKRDG